jgi:cytosine/adenosine deaminase-related metal-dependent hydrolase
MLLRLTRPIRVRVGWLIALAYLLCILAPGAALALGNGPAPCLTDSAEPAAMIPMHHGPGVLIHMHADGSSHDHAGMHADTGGAPAKHRHDGKTSSEPCCAILCVTALPATLPMLVKPSQPVSMCASDIYRSVQGKAPPLLYRPPIA